MTTQKNKLNKDNFELLMPAGSFEKAKYAIEFGADAIYCGIPMFTLRGKSTMDMKELKKIVPYAHKKGVKVYFAVNIFPHSFKYEQFLKDMKLMVEEIKPDAFIMADPGLIDVTKEKFPNTIIHLSVQANNVNWMSVNFWKKQGIKRVILARELTLKEVQEIHKKVPDMELEFFIHGSNCIAYSGRCLLSNYFNYRDSNQGVCNNACRFEYKVYKSKYENFFEPLQSTSSYKNLEKGTYLLEEAKRKGELFEIEEDSTGTYLLNSKDNCMAEHIQKLQKAGICSFKVEGRTKSVYYASVVARTYRKLFDDIIKGNTPDINWAINELNTTSNRGFIPGFLEGNPKENSIDYAKKCSHQTHLFAGIVRKIIQKSPKKIKTLVFDFDGVIANSFSACYEPSKMKHEGLTEEEYLSWFLGNIYEKETSLKEINFNIDFWEEYIKIAMKIQPNENVKEVLTKLKKKYKLFINSSTPKEYIEKYLEEFNMTGIFDEICGSEISTSKVKKFEYLFEKYNFSKDYCVFITDTVGDVLEGRKLGVQSIVVDFGFHNRDTLKLSHPFSIINHFNELEKEIGNLNNTTFTKIEVETRCKFKVGDELEFIMPLPEEIKKWKVDKITKAPDKELKEVSGGLEFNVILEVPFEIKNEYCVIRRKLKENEQT